MRMTLSTTIIARNLTPAQCRAARALLSITQSELAEAAGLGLSTVVDFEKERRKVSNHAIKAIRDALKRAGIAFNEGGVAVASPSTRITGACDNSTRFPHVTGAQVRMARAALNWTVRDLAEATGLHRNTITNIEVGRYAGDQKSIETIRIVLRKAGVELIDEDGGGAGARLRKSVQRKSRRK
jgi:transcriptional regulator with XRE-family HTH domain